MMEKPPVTEKTQPTPPASEPVILQWSAPERVAPQTIVIGHSVGNRPIECQILGTGGRVVLFLATIHGNEAAGTLLLGRLARHLTENPGLLEGRKVILVPVANPDGWKAARRHNARDVDLNRNFPASNRRDRPAYGSAALSEPESRALDELLKRVRPERIISFHQPLGCIDYDGPGETLAHALAAAAKLPVQKLGGRPGSLGSYAGDLLKIPTITVELPGAAGRQDEASLWARYRDLLLAALDFPARVE